MQELIQYALSFSIIAYVWACVLVQGGNIFDFVPKLYYRVIGFSYPKLESMLFGCAKCFGGQISLWGYPIICQSYDIREHITIVILTIFFAKILESKI